MKRTLQILCLLLVSCTAIEKKPTEERTELPVSEKPAVTNRLPKDTSEILFTVKNIVDLSVPNRTVGRPGHKKVFNYLKSEFEKIAKAGNGKVFVHEFKPDVEFAAKTYQNDFNTLVAPKYKKEDATYKKWDGFTNAAIKFTRSFRKYKGKNLVLELPGTGDSKEVVYVSAHYDSITHNHATMAFTPDAVAPAADDNASGVAALIYAARKMSALPRNKTIRFVAFDFEEVFFLGSIAFARDLKNNKMKFVDKSEKFWGLINLEMLGWSKKAPVLKIYLREKVAADLKIADHIKSQAGGLNLDVQLLANGFNRSDNWSFWENGFMAVTLSEDWESDFNEKNYHTANDLAETLNYSFLQEVSDLLVASLKAF